MIHMLVTALAQAIAQEMAKAAPDVQKMIATQLQYLAESTYKYMNPKKDDSDDKKEHK